MITQFHTPDGVFTIDTATVTDDELATLLNMTRQNLDNYLAEQNIFSPPSGTGVPEKLAYLEDFLGGIYPP